MTVPSPFKKRLLIAAGCLAVGLGAIGIIAPLLPTTPFLLLAAYCFMRSSPELHSRLMASPLFGGLIRDYQAGKGIPLGAKVSSILLLWLSICASALLLGPIWWVRALLFGIAIAVTVHLLRLPTRRSPARKNSVHQSIVEPSSEIP